MLNSSETNDSHNEPTTNSNANCAIKASASGAEIPLPDVAPVIITGIPMEELSPQRTAPPNAPTSLAGAGVPATQPAVAAIPLAGGQKVSLNPHATAFVPFRASSPNVPGYSQGSGSPSVFVGSVRTPPIVAGVPIIIPSSSSVSPSAQPSYTPVLLSAAEIAATQKSLFSLNGVSCQTEFDERLLAAFMYVHDNNLLAVSSTTRLPGAPATFLQPFWGRFPVDAFNFAEWVIASVEHVTTTSAAVSPSELGGERAMHLKELYLGGLQPLLQSASSNAPHESSLRTQLLQIISCATDPITEADVTDAVSFSMRLLLFVVRLSFSGSKERPMTMEEAESLSFLREQLFACNEGRTFLRCCLSMMLLSRAHTAVLTQAVSELSSNASATDANGAEGTLPPVLVIARVKRDFCAKYADMVIQFLSLPCHSSISQWQASFADVYTQNDIVIRAAMGDALSAVERFRSLFYIAPTSVCHAMAQRRGAAGGTTPPHKHPNASMPLRIAVPLPTVQPGPPPPVYVAPKVHHSASSSLEGLVLGSTVTPTAPVPQRAPSNMAMLHDAQDLIQKQLCDSATVLHFLITSIVELDLASTATIRDVLTALDTYCCDGDRSHVDQSCANCTTHHLQDLVDVAARILSPHDAQHRKVIRSGLATISKRVASAPNAGGNGVVHRPQARAPQQSPSTTAIQPSPSLAPVVFTTGTIWSDTASSAPASNNATTSVSGAADWTSLWPPKLP